MTNLDKPIFGKSFKLSYTIRADGSNIDSFSLTSARLYSSNPTTSQKEDHDNTSPGDAVESVVSWSNGDEEEEKIISFSAITDSDPHSPTAYEEYYLVVSVKYADGGADNFLEPKIFQVWRPTALLSRTEVSVDDVRQRERKIGIERSNAEIDNYISAAERYTLKLLKGKGYDVDRLAHSDLKDLIIARALYYACNEISSDTGDRWETKAEQYKLEFDDLMSTQSIGYDFDDNSEIDPDEKFKAGSHLVIR